MSHHQIEILNESFNIHDTSLLTDTLKKWVGNFNISFELAYRDPVSILTNGITKNSYNSFNSLIGVTMLNLTIPMVKTMGQLIDI